MSESKNCHVEPIEKSFDISALHSAQVTYLSVSGMGCPRCATRVRNSLVMLEGVLLADVTMEMMIAAVAYDPASVTPAALKQAVTDAGNDGKHHYQAEVIKNLPAREVLQL
jgi:copper chaperone CopZ